MPLEVVMPIVKKLTKEDYEKRDELQKMLATIKKEFTQSTVISCLVGQMALIIEEVSIWFFTTHALYLHLLHKTWLQPIPEPTLLTK